MEESFELLIFIAFFAGICGLLSIVDYGYTKWKIKRKSKPLN